jgi:hypothetical protein
MNAEVTSGPYGDRPRKVFHRPGLPAVLLSTLGTNLHFRRGLINNLGPLQLL